MSRHLLLTAIATLAITGCVDGPVAPSDTRDAPTSGPAFLASGDRWGIFDGLTPAYTISLSSDWEVGTRFHVTTPGCVVQLRFYRAAGETGLNTVKLWDENGDLLMSQDFYYATTGWNFVELRDHEFGPYIDASYCIDTDTDYYVSVNTNTKHVKTLGFLNSGPYVTGPVVVDTSFYSSTTGVMPNMPSTNGYFVDVVFEEDSTGLVP